MDDNDDDEATYVTLAKSEHAGRSSCEFVHEASDRSGCDDAEGGEHGDEIMRLRECEKRAQYR